MARYSFSGSILPKSEDKIHHYKQRFRKIATTIVLDKDENLLWSGLQWHRSWHRGNEITPLPILLTAKSLSVIEMLWNEVFMVRNTVKNGQSWCLAVICRKQSAFDMLFYLTVVSIFLKTCVKDHEDSSSRLLERRIWLVCIEALLLVGGFVKISVYFNKLASNFQTVR